MTLLRRHSQDQGGLRSPISIMPTNADPETCWQCGAEADIACRFVQRLDIDAKRGADGQGFPVSRGRWKDRVRVPVPRCSACRTRKFIFGSLILGSGIGGAGIGSVLLPTKGFGLCIGWISAPLTTTIVIARYEKRAGRRSVSDYPASVSLRRAGWSEPNDN